MPYRDSHGRFARRPAENFPLGPQVPGPDNPLPDFRGYNFLNPRINAWSYKPDPIFFGDGPLFLGLELEVSFDRYSSDEVYGSRCASWFLRDLGYLKRDGSVEGFEIVTHPMSYEWFTENFPFQMLPDLSRQNGYIDISTNGLHVHVSRAGFGGAAHAYRWMKLLYRNYRQVERIGGRHTQWASFGSDIRNSQFYHLKNTIIREKEEYQEGRRNIPRRDRDLEEQGLTHYAAINNMPRETYELRAFGATLDIAQFKARVQLAAASVQYTRTMRAKDITRDKGWEWNRFADWVHKNEGTYPELAVMVTADDQAAARIREQERIEQQEREQLQRRAAERAARLQQQQRRDREQRAQIAAQLREQYEREQDAADTLRQNMGWS